MTMIKKIAMAASVAAIGFATPAFADAYTPPSVNGTATVRLYTAIDLTKVSDVDFGTVIRTTPTDSGTVVMNSGGVIDCTAVTGITCTGSPARGHFTITGDSGSDMSVSMTGATYDPATNVISLANGPSTVDLTLSYGGMTQDTDPVTFDTLGTFSVTGTGAATDIYLYGSLAVGDAATNPNGVYTASFNLTADYK